MSRRNEGQSYRQRLYGQRGRVEQSGSLEEDQDPRGRNFENLRVVMGREIARNGEMKFRRGGQENQNICKGCKRKGRNKQQATAHQQSAEEFQ
ncbi:uncharacterized protein Z519_11451 [Cladophialophora bantiana CBS 173.52]|uniref:Uncharacterized protein n=1 Tax=Cladophialophora bantiana (strain ATCC 10958 / CBS 173.52 / CDC B-1940 / NIH 8579) TaxID=1442370 RepID=A0A0D2FMC8_CLAB1|nr:uncharacterized protein Z519_11451 [Cladophialophora bantiana CBS 173.52]KIW87867.1 hypothetical protein Z519_11451 [Cladophialophora bantiana CBS 173.52]